MQTPNPPEPRSPGDTPLSDVTARLDEQVGDGQFGAVDGARVRCYTCRTDTPADRFSADAVTRLEGASDPADMAIVIPVECPNCHAVGALTLNYGPDADAAEADVLLAMERTPTVGSVGSAPTPGMPSTDR